MKYPGGVIFFILLTGALFGQARFEGIFTVHFTSEKKEALTLEVKAKDSLIYLKPVVAKAGKYDHYILNLSSRDFYTVSKPDKKVVIKYNLDTLLALYEKEDLKEGFTIHSPLVFKPADKTKDE